ncbi:MAG: flavodoxin-dependent (E)-4-hydroxy-3-methylbut-2-enyl-diphosphate synthase [Clostridia bacterium]|nr:flavodoxin-dependent (E)-4-hydroxy-3-methylbut-2-enyl-diphosphate synthase [Clostridia bacterium]
METLRRNTKKVMVGDLPIGGGERIKIQSMTTARTSDIDAVTRQIKSLEDAGCDLVRMSVLDEADAKAIRSIKDRIKIPLCADIHFSSSLAIAAVENGCDKVRVNPGNIGSEAETEKVAACLRSHSVPVRVGVNSGSLKKEYLEKYGRTAEALVSSAMDEVRRFEKFGVRDIVVSVKSSSVRLTVDAYTELSRVCPYPLHLGVTEAGLEESAVIKSAAAFSPLLLSGIGDTVRVSVTGDPVREILAAKSILRALELDTGFAEVISCPTCGRCTWDVQSLAEKVTERVKGVTKHMKIAVMGCVVNGPGEASDADLGIAGGDGYCLIFKDGKPVRKVDAASAEREFMNEIEGLVNGF